MKSPILALLVFLVVGATCFAQASIQPQHRFALRVNTLGMFNLDLIGDVEYCLSERIGVFIGGGSEFIHPYHFAFPADTWFKKEPDEVCKNTNWGVYAGTRISIPVWKLTGLALRPSVFFQSTDKQGYCYSSPTNGGAITSYKSKEVGIALSLAYTQRFAKWFFIEPVVGLAPEVAFRDMVREGVMSFWTCSCRCSLILG